MAFDRPVERGEIANFNKFLRVSYTMVKWIGIDTDIKKDGDCYCSVSRMSHVMTVYSYLVKAINRIFFGQDMSKSHIPVTDSLRSILPPKFATATYIAYVDLIETFRFHMRDDRIPVPMPIQEAKCLLYRPIIDVLNFLKESVKVCSDKETLFDYMAIWFGLGLPTLTNLANYNSKCFKYYSKQLQSELISIDIIMRRMGVYSDVKLLIFAAVVNDRKDRVR